MNAHEEFFNDHGDEHVSLHTWGGEIVSTISVEDLYENFKARLLSEMQVAVTAKD